MAESNKMVVKQFLDLYNLGAWEQLESIISPNYIHHSNASNLSLKSFKRGAEWFRVGMPDFRIEVQDMLAEGDRVAMRFTGHGTHLGSLYGETPTSKPMIVYGMLIYRVENNLIMEDWETVDEHDFMKQLGAIPPDK
jgi:predicted ester cyclase